ncbi:indolepyruvate oxidoreductase subunit beta [Acetivibrio sp. MSJd-27]|jgi:hypothetical protein|uniref:indolepyruvate oxidoreductase subunit beta n=1 Tax=Acetivibrio sp. MSJd-27 TaxID=2841523 RepID=UPI0015A88873|nr:indolepyruvate oxidoreductase subunit beta [Acetivibrio sp. MSJd-27]MBU5451036.1 indolepyruvate oxidoreductase subunit beta [Acetivibrio sp. MSJd-27]
MKPFNILITGVGGQGTVLASRLIAQTAIELGALAKTSETIGMAQRGGCVTSHVRIGEDDISPLIPLGKADLLLAFEPAEAVRNLKYLKKGGSMVVNTRAILPVTCAMGTGYEPEQMLEYLKKQKDRKVIFADAGAICEELGSFKVINTVMLGIALKNDLLPFTKEDLEQTMRKFLPERFQEINRKAVNL